jgi:hypothetical protein
MEGRKNVELTCLVNASEAIAIAIESWRKAMPI